MNNEINDKKRQIPTFTVILAAVLSAVAALLARGVHKNKANVATARELACWVWAVGLMAEGA